MTHNINNYFCATKPQGDKVSIYIHWPFCTQKCPYCDFNSYVQKNINHNQWIASYMQAIHNQLEYYKNKEIISIFFGGGTPSLMNPQNVKTIVDHFNLHNKNLGHRPIAEITLEANPSTFEIVKFKEFKEAGINRLSIGIQSFSDDNLKFLGRNHNSETAINALKNARDIFDKMSFDLIIGLPNQTFQNLQRDINIALEYIKGHISIYQLTIEKGTPFYKNDVKTIDEDSGAKFYSFIVDKLEDCNIKQYEISNFAEENHHSIHNMNYWVGGEYIGIGPNAWGRVFHKNQWISTREYKNPNKWLEKTHTCQIEEIQNISSMERFEEIIMTHLRVNIPLPIQLVKLLDTQKIDELLQEELLLQDSNSIITSKKGKMCLNYVIYKLLS